jgi:hypothetical protein
LAVVPFAVPLIKMEEYANGLLFVSFTMPLISAEKTVE